MRKEEAEEYQKFVESLKNEVCRLTEGWNAKIMFQPAQADEEEDYLVVELAAGNGMHIQRFHMKEIYQDLKSGEIDREELFDKIADTLDYYKEVGEICPIDKIEDYEEIRNRLIVRPLNYNNHREKLDTGIYSKVGDIALVLYVHIGSVKGQYVSSMVPVKAFSLWKQIKDDVIERALKNTYDLFPPRVVNIFDRSDSDQEVYCSFMDKEALPMDTDGIYGIFVTNTIQINGAVSVFLPGVARKLGELLEGDFYIAFTSLHEAVIHKIGTVEMEMVQKSLKGLNMEQTSDEGFLSKQVYRYSREKDRISLA